MKAKADLKSLNVKRPVIAGRSAIRLQPGSVLSNAANPATSILSRMKIFL